MTGVDELRVVLDDLGVVTDRVAAEFAALEQDAAAAQDRADQALADLAVVNAEIERLRRLLCPFPVVPGVVADLAHLDAIDITVDPWKAGYDKIIASGSTTTTPTRATQRYSARGYVPAQFGTLIPATLDAMNMHRDDGIAATVQATLYEATDDPVYLANAVRILTAYADITSIPPDSKEARRLYAAWAACGFVRALAIVGDFPARARLVATLRMTYWPLLTFTTGPNWLMSMCQARLGIAVAAGDRTLFDQAVGEFNAWLRAGIWITSDGPLVNPIPGAADNGSGWQYPLHWFNAVSSNRLSGGLAHGQSAEHTRDPSHVQMGLGSAMDAVLTATAQGVDLVELHRERLVAAFEFAATKVRATLAAGGTPGGGTAWKQGWLAALDTYGSRVLPTVDALVASDVTIRVPATGNAQVVEGLVFPYR